VRHVRVLLSIAVATATAGCSADLSLPDEVEFNRHVQPILSDRCFSCHGPDANARESQFRLDTEEGAFAVLKGEEGAHAIVAGDLSSSVLYRRISSADPAEVMPPPESNRTLSDREVALIARWIEQGAAWQRHWAFIPPRPEDPPDPIRDWPTVNAIDRFVHARLAEARLSPSPAADRATLLRRVTFDLTGLPPTLEQLDAFGADDAPDAFERVVDRLLADPAFGERMASLWLDAARYADSHGYQDDLERTIWPWRDWVIHAFNSGMPYDDFGRLQLAGDLLPEATLSQILATGFNRNHMITQEGGVIDEEFRVAYVSDRTSTVGSVFLGLTMDCARCHDHKFDPITQSDYYGLFAFFNQVDEQGVIDYQTRVPRPALRVPYERVRSELGFVTALADGDSLASMVMADMDTLVRPTHVLERGRYDMPLEAVDPGTPDAVLPFPDDLSPDRLGFAEWLFDPANPLTARVAANRFWSMLFGRGIVSTEDDFGSQGARPTHPALLDWLALELVRSGWDTKALLKTIVLSATYRQSSQAGAELLAADPDNTLLARGPRFRLPAEALRDHALAQSGLLVRTIGGPSVKPYQPEGIWEEKTGGGGGSLARYERDSGEALYRRSLYTFWKRTVPPPSMMTFDAPDRSFSSVHRQTTSTPLQSMVLMNDPQLIEAARALAYRMIDEGGATPEERVTFAFRLMTARHPDSEETAELTAYFDEELERFGTDREAAADLLAVGELPHPEMHDEAEAAAYTMVVSAIFNLYETITRT
jgi:hypothetical protein